MRHHLPIALLAAAPAAAQNSLAPSAGPNEPLVTAEEPPALEAVLGWVDWNGDGRLDAVALQPGGSLLLLAAEDDGAFVDRTSASGLGGIEGAHAVAWADVDGDGDEDLYVAAWRGASRLFLQGEEGLFQDFTRVSGLPPAIEPIRASFIDYDADGRPDLHVVTVHDDLVFHNEGRGQFQRVRTGIVPRLRVPGSAPLVGPSSPVGAGGGQPTSPPIGSSSLTFCPDHIIDQGGGACIRASSVPMLGMLYPLSSDLYVDGAGRVGVGTTTPGTRFEVAGVARADRFVSDVGGGTAPLVVNSSTKVDGLNVDLLDGLDSADFRSAASPISGADVLDDSLTSADLAAGSVGASELATGAVTAAKIAANAVGAPAISAGAVGTSELGNGAVVAAKIAGDAVTAAAIAAGAVGSSEIATNAVDSSKIAAGAVGSSEIAAGAVGSSEIATGAVASDEIANGSVTAADLAAGSVGSSALAPGSVANVHVAGSAAIAGTKISPDFGAQPVSSTGGFESERSGVGQAGFVGRNSIGPPTAGYVGVQGDTDFDGVTSADWSGDEIGIAGISVGGSAVDNYAVMGHSNGVGVRGEHSGAPSTDFAELGLAGIGLRANGSSRAAVFENTVEIDNTGGASLIVSGGVGIETADLTGGDANFSTLKAVNDLNGPAGLFRTLDSPGSFTGYTVSAQARHEGGALIATQNTVGTSDAVFFSSSSVVSTNEVLHVVRGAASAANTAFFDINNTSATGDVVNIRNRGTGAGLTIDAQQGDGAVVDSLTTSLLLDRSNNTGDILVAQNGTDVEFRVESSGNVFCDGSFTGGGADYAEWLERLVPSEDLAAGDVVGVFGGRITRRTAGADQVMVVSTDPCVVGNGLDAEESARAGHEVVAFMGQTPVRVHGPVEVGDLLVPSGRGDGVAVAIARADLGADQVGDVFATAWEPAGYGEQLVNAAIGVDQSRAAALVIEALHAEAAAQRAALEELLRTTLELAERLERLESR